MVLSCLNNKFEEFDQSISFRSKTLKIRVSNEYQISWDISYIY